MHFTIRYREACALHISGHFYFPCRISANFGASLLTVKFSESPFHALGDKGTKKIIAVAVDAWPGYALPAFARRKECGMRVFFETERLLLRRFTESDTANLHDLDGQDGRAG